MLKRRERGGHCARVAWKMQNPRHLAACLAVRAGERHSQRAFDRVRRNAKILVACCELAVKIDSELVGGCGGQIELCRPIRHAGD